MGYAEITNIFMLVIRLYWHMLVMQKLFSREDVIKCIIAWATDVFVRRVCYFEGAVLNLFAGTKVQSQLLFDAELFHRPQKSFIIFDVGLVFEVFLVACNISFMILIRSSSCLIG